MGNSLSQMTGRPNLALGSLNWWDATTFANTLSLSEGLAPCYTLTGCTGTEGRDFTCTGISVTAASGNPYDCTGYRLPTEAEWEYAYRAGTTTAFYSGPITHTGSSPLDPNLDAIGWYIGNAGGNGQNVARKLPNAWGLYDMAGNLWEWCWDWYGTYPGAVSDPLGPTTGSLRVFRGGSFDIVASGARAAYRDNVAPSLRDGNRGFRLARTAP
jgi:formylglycine-generating enzyme required for sulfatase activity